MPTIKALNQLKSFILINSNFFIIDWNNSFSLIGQTEHMTGLNLSDCFVCNVIKDDKFSTVIWWDDLHCLGVGIPLYLLNGSRMLIVVSFLESLDCENFNILTGKPDRKVFWIWRKADVIWKKFTIEFCNLNGNRCIDVDYSQQSILRICSYFAPLGINCEVYDFFIVLYRRWSTIFILGREDLVYKSYIATSWLQEAKSLLLTWTIRPPVYIGRLAYTGVRAVTKSERLFSSGSPFLS